MATTLTITPQSTSVGVTNQVTTLTVSAAIAGAATGMSAAAGSIAATQAASIATTAAAAAYSLEGLKSARVVTIQVDEKNSIQTFSSN